jgi:hypothetical protein
LLDVDDGLTMSAKVLHIYNGQRRVKGEERRDIMPHQIIHSEVLNPKASHNHKVTNHELRSS